MYLTSETRIDKKGREYFYVKNIRPDESMMSATVFPAPSDPEHTFAIYIWWQKSVWTLNGETYQYQPFEKGAVEKKRRWVQRYLYMNEMCVTAHYARHICDAVIQAVRNGESRKGESEEPGFEFLTDEVNF